MTAPAITPLTVIGKPCPKGHTRRYAKNGVCFDCQQRPRKAGRKPYGRRTAKADASAQWVSPEEFENVLNGAIAG